MSTSRGVFDDVPNPPAGGPVSSPFIAAEDSAAATSPFTAASPVQSPFSVASSRGDEASGADGKGSKIPEKRRPESPFQMADPQEGFGFEPTTSPSIASPFAVPPSQAPVRPQESPSAPPFGAWPPVSTAAFSSPAQPPAQPFQVPAVAQPVRFQPDPQSDSYSIRQLELRAIFGVDREMSTEEILQRARALPGIRQIALVGEQDVTAIDAVKGMLARLGFGNGPLRLHTGSVPVEFIREGNVLLAVQTDGGFAPGVRETIMIVARELARPS
jgi:hypothetical protein